MYHFIHKKTSRVKYKCLWKEIKYSDIYYKMQQVLCEQ